MSELKLNPEMQKEIQQFEETALKFQDFKVTTQEQYTTAGDYLRSIKQSSKKLEDLRVSMTKPLDESKRRIMDLFRQPLEKLIQAELALKRGMLGYQQEQERKRREEEDRLQEIARKEAERLSRRADKAEDKGNIAKAEELRLKSQETASITPFVAPTIQKAEGTSTKKLWKFEVVNSDLIPREYLTPDLIKIGKMVRASGEILSIPGIKIYSEETLSIRS